MGKGGGKRRRRRNASKKKRWNKMLQDKWSRQQKINMKRLIGQDPNDIKPVIGTIDGRDWTTFFPAPNKDSGFSFLEFTRRMESIQDDYPERLMRELKGEVLKKNVRRSREERLKNWREEKERTGKAPHLPLSLKKHLFEKAREKEVKIEWSQVNPYKSVNNLQGSDNDNDSDDEKW